MSTRPIVIRGLLALATAALWAPTAAAQPAPPPGPPRAAPEPERSGVFFGGGLGVGSMTFTTNGSDDSFGSFGYRAAFGGLIRPEIALAVEVWGTSSPQEDDETGATYTVHQSNIGAWLRYWLTPRFWLQGGFGTARAGSRGQGSSDSPTYHGASLLAGVGYEMVHQRGWALELAGRLTASGYESPGGGEVTSSSLVIDLGLVWY